MPTPLSVPTRVLLSVTPTALPSCPDGRCPRPLTVVSSAAGDTADGLLSPPVAPLTVLSSPPAAWLSPPVDPAGADALQVPPSSDVTSDSRARRRVPPVPSRDPPEEPSPPAPVPPSHRPTPSSPPVERRGGRGLARHAEWCPESGRRCEAPAVVPAAPHGRVESAWGAMNAAATAAPVTATPATALRRPRTRAATGVMHAGTAVRRTENGAANERAGGDEETCQRFLGIRHDGELALEGLAGPPEQRLDRSDLDTLVVGDLLVGPAGSFAHCQNVTVARRQTVERVVDQFAIDCGEDEFLGGVLADHARPVFVR